MNHAVKQAFEAALKIFADAAARSSNLDIPELRYAAMTSMLTSSAESAGINRRWFRERHQDFVPARGPRYSRWHDHHRIRISDCPAGAPSHSRGATGRMTKIDIIAAPTTARVAPLLVRRCQRKWRRYPSRELQSFQSSALPEHARPAGLFASLRHEPEYADGMQLIGAWFADQTVLNAAPAYQSATDWHTTAPCSRSALLAWIIHGARENASHTVDRGASLGESGHPSVKVH